MEKGIYLCEEEKALIGTEKATEAAKLYIELANKIAKNVFSDTPLTYGKSEYVMKVVEHLKNVGVKDIKDASEIIQVCNCKAMALLGMIPTI